VIGFAHPAVRELRLGGTQAPAGAVWEADRRIPESSVLLSPPEPPKMLASYGPIARRSAVVAAGAAVIMIALSTAFGGSKGLLGSVLGAALVLVFFTISIAAVSRAEKVSPRAQMVTALTTFIVKILVLMVLVSRFSNTTVFNARLFGLTAIVCILVWSGAQVFWSMRLKVLYVEPDGER
jgi:ATP synthase protein I